jgi:hypothetical protein
LIAITIWRSATSAYEHRVGHITEINVNAGGWMLARFANAL